MLLTIKQEVAPTPPQETCKRNLRGQLYYCSSRRRACFRCLRKALVFLLLTTHSFPHCCSPDHKGIVGEIPLSCARKANSQCRPSFQNSPSRHCSAHQGRFCRRFSQKEVLPPFLTRGRLQWRLSRNVLAWPPAKKACCCCLREGNGAITPHKPQSSKVSLVAGSSMPPHLQENFTVGTPKGDAHDCASH